MEKTGTMIYIPKEINGEPVDRNNSFKDFLPVLDSPPPPIHSHEDLIKNVQLGSEPLKMRMCSTYQIVLDENHRLLSLHMDCYEFSFTPLSRDEVL
eukprot:gene5719-6146_t